MLIRTTLLLASFATLPAILATAQSETLSPSDHIEIQQLYARYNYVMDSTDAKMLPTVFTPDATLGPPDNRVRARDVLEGLVPKERPQVYRLTTNIIISASPEGARGTASVILVNILASPPTLMGGGVYEDVMVKTPEGWRFKSRTYYHHAINSPGTSAGPPDAAR